MIKLSELLSEKSPCWKGYKQIGMKEKDGKEVPNCVPINELSATSTGVPEFLVHAEKQQYPFLQFPSFDDLKDYVLDASIEEFQELKDEAKINEAFFIGEDQTIKCEKCGWEWKLDTGGEDSYVCHKCGHDNSEIDEYDVENVDDMKEFVEFMREYQQQLNEADCDCLLEAKYQGRTVPLGKPMQGDSKKFKVYVKNPKTGKVVKVNFGAKGMNIKKNNPVRRKAFRARHNCTNPGPRTKARYWSCRKW